MDSILNDPEMIRLVVGAIVSFLGVIGGAIALQIRENGRLNRNLKTMKADQEVKEKEHNRALELAQSQIMAAQVRDARETENRLERRVEELLESRLKDMEADLQAIKAERQRLREMLAEETRQREKLSRDSEQLKRDMLRERELREQLESDFTSLKEKFEALQREKASVEVENTNLRTENAELRGRLDKLQVELDSTRFAMSELERQLHELEAKVRNGQDDDPPPTEPDHAPKATNVTPLNADGAAHSATVDLPVVKSASEDAA